MVQAVRQLESIPAPEDAAAQPNDALAGEPELVIAETPSFRRVTQGCEYAHTGALVLIYGGAGVGKTTAAKVYASAHWEHGKAAYYINMHGVKSPAAMLQTIAEGMGAHSALGAYRNVSLMQSLADRLMPGELLICDESQSLRHDALDLLRYFLDERNVGLVVMGNELVFSTIAGKNRRAMFAQLHSRVSMRIHIPQSTEADADKVLKQWGISEGAARDYGRQIALGPGGLRQLVKVLAQARIAHVATKRALDHRLLHAAASALGLTD